MEDILDWLKCSCVSLIRGPHRGCGMPALLHGRIWDTRASKCMETINGTGANLNVTWSPDGNTVAFGNREDVISFLDIRKMKVCALLDAEASSAEACISCLLF